MLDQAWARRDDLVPRDVSVWLWARGIRGLPAWLRLGRLVGDHWPREIPESLLPSQRQGLWCDWESTM